MRIHKFLYHEFYKSMRIHKFYATQEKFKPRTSPFEPNHKELDHKYNSYVCVCVCVCVSECVCAVKVSHVSLFRCCSELWIETDLGQDIARLCEGTLLSYAAAYPDYTGR